MPTPAAFLVAAGIGLVAFGVAGIAHGVKRVGQAVVHVVKHGARKQTTPATTAPPQK